MYTNQAPPHTHTHTQSSPPTYSTCINQVATTLLTKPPPPPYLSLSTQSSPPAYNVSQLTVQTALFYGEKDWLADPQDVHQLINTLPPDVFFFKKNITFYDHLDFIWGVDAASEVYDVIISCILNGTCED